MCPTPPIGWLIVPTHPSVPLGGEGATTAHSAFTRMRPYAELPYVPNYWWARVPIMFLSKRCAE
jgi:hypothetical protein